MQGVTRLEDAPRLIIADHYQAHKFMHPNKSDKSIAEMAANNLDELANLRALVQMTIPRAIITLLNFGRVGEFVLHDNPAAFGDQIYRIEPLKYISGNIDLVSS